MHTFIPLTDGWTLETLADDSDNPNSSPTLETELQGCCIIKEVRESLRYLCEIRYEEQRHNELVYVEAVVLEKYNTDEYTEKDIEFFRRKKFEGERCKRNAAAFATSLKKFIDKMYFH